MTTTSSSISRSATLALLASSFLLTSLVLIADSCLVENAAVFIALKDRGSGRYQPPTEAP
jgi:hypothetical protein